MQPLEIPDRRWDHVTMDLITCLPKTQAGHDAILVFVDKLTKMTHLAATTTNVTAEGVAQLFIDRVVCLHGVPGKLISDRDPRFTGRFFKAVCDSLATRNAFSTAFHPQTDGQTERMNRVVEEMMRHYVSADQSDWDLKLSLCEFAINSSYQASTQHSPFFLNYGQDPLTPVTVRTEALIPGARVFTEQLHATLRAARTHLHAASQRQKALADTKRRDERFAVGDQVMLSTKNIKLKAVGSPKLLPRWIGPLRVLRVVHPTALHLELPATYTMHPVFHVSLLKRYVTSLYTQPVPPAPEIDPDGTPSYEVECVLAHKQGLWRGKPEWVYLVKWTGYGAESNEWVPAHQFHASDLINAYWDSVGGPPGFAVRDTPAKSLAPIPAQTRVRSSVRLAAKVGGV
jgi:hypothetical protein